MASPERIDRGLPKTLPEDFRDWDGETSSAGALDNFAGTKAAPAIGQNTQPRGPSGEREPQSSAAARDRAEFDDFLKNHELINGLVDRLHSRSSHDIDAGPTNQDVFIPPSPLNIATVSRTLSPPVSKATVESGHETDAAPIPAFLPSTAAVFGMRKAAGKKWMIVAAVSACSILLLLIFIIPLFKQRTDSAALQSVQPVPAGTQLQTSAPTPAQAPLSQGKVPQTINTPPATDNQSADEAEEVNSARVQTSIMNDQLTAPTRIPQGLKTQVAENAPPPLNIGTDGLGGSGANDSIFTGRELPIVKAAPVKPVAISAGVAVGMLMQKTAPSYPAIAKAAKVSGTVELQATISKTGTIKDLRVVNGPAMLRQAALDAVRNWRYKPYRLNNEPTEVEATINVVFSLGG